MNLKLNLYTRKKHILVGMLAAAFLFSPTAHAENQNPATISVTATGTAIQAPDIAIVQMYVETQSETARQALSDNSQTIAEVRTAMKKLGIEEKDIQTFSLRIAPDDDSSKRKPSSARKQRKSIGHHAGSAIEVYVRDLTILGDVLDEAVILGVNRAGRTRLSLSNPDTVLEQARNNAVARALAKAQTLSSAAGVKLGRIAKISQTSEDTAQFRIFRSPASSSRRRRRPPAALQRNTYFVTVTVEWEIAQ